TVVMVGKAGQNTIIDYNTLLANKHMVRTYAEIATSRTVLQRVKDQTRLPLDVVSLRKKISVELVRDTELIEIAVEDTSPQTAFIIANALTAAFPRRVSEILSFDNVSVIDQPSLPVKPVRPVLVINLAVAGISGLLLALAMEMVKSTRANNHH
ncbi:MAG TPA: lipopolysaccharide biosynthesis protein, partial [Bacillota bacterium]|nr:lipopolysaccharide biosynthesis protein [Bacillota bacterium]